MSPARRGKLLVVDDEQNQRTMLERILRRAGYEVQTAEDGERALAALDGGVFDLLLTDQRMPAMDGLRLLGEVRRRQPQLPVVLMTAYGSVSNAVEAIKLGAADYLTKPFDAEELLLVIEKVRRQRVLEEEVATLRSALRDRHRLGGLLGHTPVMQELFSTLERVASADVPVLLRGESGTGKELAARAIHALSSRAEGPFVALNCAAIPENLLESEFFGYERGAFSGAESSHAGRFEQAHGGVLLLDEIGAMRVDLQAKLLRALQEGEVTRLGARAPRPVDVRILSSTCEDLEAAIAEGRFREDLYYRLNVVPIELPPLRERIEDVPLLADHFLKTCCERHGRPLPRLDPRLLDRLQAHSWPGNVRELHNLVERLSVLGDGERLRADDLPLEFGTAHRASAGQEGFALPAEGVQMAEVERSLILQALERSAGHLAPAAHLLGLSYKTLQYRIRKHGIDRERFRPNRGGEARPI